MDTNADYREPTRSVSGTDVLTDEVVFRATIVALRDTWHHRLCPNADLREAHRGTTREWLELALARLS